jgi:hypothetical protein
LNQLIDKALRRTELGNVEVRARHLDLGRLERKLLSAIDGELEFEVLHKKFESEDSSEFSMAIIGLMEKQLIAVEASNEGATLVNDNVAAFAKDDFFSSSLDPMSNGSGTVVDTRKKSIQGVRLIPENPLTEVGRVKSEDVDVLLPLELESGESKDRNRSANEVVPTSTSTEASGGSRRSRKDKAAPAENTDTALKKLKANVYIVLVILGLLLIAAAILK